MKHQDLKITVVKIKITKLWLIQNPNGYKYDPATFLT